MIPSGTLGRTGNIYHVWYIKDGILYIGDRKEGESIL